jgi:cell wall assembly regulator SMI1
VTASEIFGEYREWLRTHVPLAYENLAPPASEADLRELESGIGFILPDDVRSILGENNGQKVVPFTSEHEHAVPCIPTLIFLSTSEIKKRWNFWAEIRQEEDDLDSLQEIGDVFPGASGLIKPLYTSPGWIPLWADPMAQDYIGIDLDPDTGGKRGQIINFGRNEEQHFLCAPDFQSLLLILLDEVKSGRWPASEIVPDEDNSLPEALPWFGDPNDNFFNILYANFDTRWGGRQSG